MAACDFTREYHPKDWDTIGLDGPALGQTHAMVARSLAMAALAIGSPSMRGRQQPVTPLDAIGITLGSPVIGTSPGIR
jgi:hypothetical protein